MCCPCLMSGKVGQTSDSPKKVKQLIKNSKVNKQLFLDLEPIKEFKVPEDYQTVDHCLAEQGLKLEKGFIGSGGFAKVYKVINIKDGTFMACKVISLTTELSDRDRER